MFLGAHEERLFALGRSDPPGEHDWAKGKLGAKGVIVCFRQGCVSRPGRRRSQGFFSASNRLTEARPICGQRVTSAFLTLLR
jgi:hypothetical protein